MQNVVDTSSPAETFKCWVELYSDSMYSYALHKTSSKETAEDLVQETFLSALQAFTKFEGKSEPKTWLFSILKNKIADHFRKTFRSQVDHTVSFSTFFDIDEEWQSGQRPQQWAIDDEHHFLDDALFKNTLEHCLEKLPPAWKAPFLLKYLAEKESQIICQELEISATNYWQILHRAKLQLRKCLESNWFKK